MKLKKTLHGLIRAMPEIEGASSTLVEEIYDAFVFKNPIYEATIKYSPWGKVSPRIEPEIKLARRFNENHIAFPRGLTTAFLSPESKAEFDSVEWQDRRVWVPANFPPQRVALNFEQECLVKAFDSAVEKNERPFGSFLFVSPTATGKSILQAEIARRIRQRTLVLCLTELILKTWYEDLYKAFGLVPSEIGLIKQGKWEIKSPFTLASVATLGRRKHIWSELYNQFGTIICDEVQTVSAPNLFDFLLHCPACYLIGASATPRKDKNNFWLNSIFGPIVKRVPEIPGDTATSLAVQDVKIISTEFVYSCGRGEILDWNDLAKYLLSNEERNALIVRNVIEDWRAGRVILIVSKRLAHVYLLKSLLEEAGIEDVNLIVGETNADRAYTESLIKAIEKRKVRCVIATVAAIKLGANIKALDCLHWAMPVANKKDIEQLLGRIRRRVEDKKFCTAVYYLDQRVPYLVNLFKRKAIPVFRKLHINRFKKMLAI